MTYKELKLKLKTELKEMAKDIRKKKSQRCAANSGYVSGLDSDRWVFRVKHLAYCMLNGTPYEKVESKHKKHQDILFYPEGKTHNEKCYSTRSQVARHKAIHLLTDYREQLDSENVA